MYKEYIALDRQLDEDFGFIENNSERMFGNEIANILIFHKIEEI